MYNWKSRLKLITGSEVTTFQLPVHFSRYPAVPHHASCRSLSLNGCWDMTIYLLKLVANCNIGYLPSSFCFLPYIILYIHHSTTHTRPQHLPRWAIVPERVGSKVGDTVPLSVRTVGSLSNTMSPGTRPTSVPSLATKHQRYRQTKQDRQDNSPIA